MKKIIIVCVVINITIISIVGYFMFFNKNANEVVNMVDVVDLNKYVAVNVLEDYDLEFIYEESEKEKNIVLKTEPSANELVQVGQTIKIYLSTGELSLYYKRLVNTYYEDNIDYIYSLENNNVNVIVETQISDDYPDGVIIYQSHNDKISDNDTFKILVNYTKPLILIPNFFNETESFVIDYLRDYNIQINFIYTKMDGCNRVYDQSIAPNTLVISGTSIYIYVAI